ncbi:MAG: ABC transporter substrate-binding protein [Defluviitaleaceae bacterium]|nr:ABC transporter substrate-binding protein [Defluviitaleaceae bacterium]MCL2835360.1 ABC transporter substrate-binding protein [Defluviitaleaceae bacterium]
MKKTFAILLTLALTFSLFTACDADSAGASGADAFRIGGTGPLTGGAAIFGNAVRNGAALAVSEINALGGTQFELNFQDDEHDAEKAVNAYNILKDWRMQIFLSSVTSTPAVATSALAYEDRFFGMTASASSPFVTYGNDNVFQMCFTDPGMGTAAASYIYNNSLGTNIAVIYKNDCVYSKGVYDAFEVRAAELDLNLVSVTTFTTASENDFSVQIAEARNNNADFLFLPMYYTPASLILAQADAIGYAPIFFGIDGMDGILTLEGFDTSLAEGVMLLTPFDAGAQDELTANFVASFQELYGEIPNQFAAGAYDVVYAIYYAILASDGAITTDMNGRDICEALIAIFTGDFTFDGVTGAGMTWSTEGVVSKNARAVVIKDGVYVGVR